MTFQLDKSNKLYEIVEEQLNTLSNAGLYLESKNTNLSSVSFAFPDISNGVANFTLEEAKNRKNCAFAAFAYDTNDSSVNYFAKCKFYDLSYEIVASSVEPKRYYIYNNEELIAYFDAEPETRFPFSANRQKEYPVYIGGKLFGHICVDSAINLDSKIIFKTENISFNLPICSKNYRRSELQEWWDIVSLRWLDFGIKSNNDLIIRNKKIRKLSHDQVVTLFVLALIIRSFFVWEANDVDYYL